MLLLTDPAFVGCNPSVRDLWPGSAVKLDWYFNGQTSVGWQDAAGWLDQWQPSTASRDLAGPMVARARAQ